MTAVIAFEWRDFDPETGDGDPSTPVAAATLQSYTRAVEAAIDAEVSAPLTTRTGVALKDQAGDDVHYFGVTWEGRRWDLRRGTASQPTRGAGPTMKISQTEMINDLAAGMGGNRGDNEANAALHVSVTSLPGSLGQPCAILATAKGAPTGTDVLASGGWARVTGGSGTAFGGYFEGRRDVSTGRAIGAEIGVREESGTDGVLSTTGGSTSMGIWVSGDSSTSNVVATGVTLGVGHATRFIAGFQAVQNSVRDFTFLDEGGSAITLKSRGAHTRGVDLSDGTYIDGAIRLPNTTTAAAGGIYFGGDAVIYRLGASALQISAGSGIYLDGDVNLVNGRNVVASASTGSKLGTAATQKLGFWGATPIVRPAGWSAASGTASRTSFATSTVNVSQLAERVKALIDDLMSAGLIGA